MIPRLVSIVCLLLLALCCAPSACSPRVQARLTPSSGPLPVARLLAYDPSLPDLQALLSGPRVSQGQLKPVPFGPELRALQDTMRVEELHLLLHGSPGRLHLPGASATLQPELWLPHMSSNSSLYIYGSGFALPSGAQSPLSPLQAYQKATGCAQVFASSRSVGGLGTWELDVLLGADGQLGRNKQTTPALMAPGGSDILDLGQQQLHHGTWKPSRGWPHVL